MNVKEKEEFMAGLAFHFACLGHLKQALIVDGDDPYAHGCTETGFYPDKVIDYAALLREIDKFAASFVNGAESRMDGVSKEPV